MFQRLQTALNYIIYFFSSGNRHSVHSPFVYDFVTRVLDARRDKPAYHGIELLRTQMLKSNAMISMRPLGAGKNKSGSKEALKTVVKRTSKSAKYGELLERICNYFQPVYALEIGTSVGISTMYQAAGIQQGHLYSLEGNPDSVKIARHNLEKLGMGHATVLEAEFDASLPVLLEQIPGLDYVFFDGDHRLESTLRYFEICLAKAHNDSVFIFDDIRWSEEMLIAWHKIKKHPSVTVSIDLYFMGIIFFRTGQEKEEFTIRF